ncbi:uncharacterized protein LOC118555510 isoform X1 [Halichoerus grypus]
MATYPPRRLLGARPLPSDPRRDPRRSGFTQGGGGSPRNLRCLCTHFQGLAARHHHLLRKSYLREKDTIGPLSSLSKQRSASSGAKGSSERELELRGTQGNCICFVHLCVSAALPKKNKHQTFHLTRILDLEDKNEMKSDGTVEHGQDTLSLCSHVVPLPTTSAPPASLGFWLPTPTVVLWVASKLCGFVLLARPDGVFVKQQ